MPIVRIVGLMLAGLAAGIAVATFWPGAGELPEPRSGGSVENRRLAELELALYEETERRAALERRIDELGAQLEILAGQPAPAAAVVPNGGDVDRAARATVTAAEAVADEPRPPQRGGQRFASPEQRVARLVEGGFTAQRAQWLMDRAEQLRMESLQAVYDARREGKPVDMDRTDEQSLLRRELGDAEYEQYLRALGRPAAVGVNDVLASSPAETAGLRPGDQIVSYGGERVFDMRDLNRLTYEGQPDQPVVVEVMRDGQRVQLVLPRGPIGITAGRVAGRP